MKVLFYLVILLMLELFDTSFVCLIFRVTWRPTKESKNMVSYFPGLSTLIATTVFYYVSFKINMTMTTGGLFLQVLSIRAGRTRLSASAPEFRLRVAHCFLGSGGRRIEQSSWERWVITSSCEKWSYYFFCLIFKVRFWVVLAEKQLCNDMCSYSLKISYFKTWCT